MRIYWSIDGIPELAAFNKEERRRIWRMHYRRIWRSWHAWGSLAIYLFVMILLMLLCAASARLVPNYIIDPENAPIIGAVVGLLPAVMIGAFVFGVLVTEITRNEIRKTLSSGISRDAVATSVGCIIRWSWIGCGGGALAGGVLGAMVGCYAGFAGGGSSGALIGASMGILTGGICGCGVGGLRAGRKLPLGTSLSVQFSIGLVAGALTAAWITLVLALGVLAIVLITRYYLGI